MVFVADHDGGGGAGGDDDDGAGGGGIASINLVSGDWEGKHDI